MIVNNVQVIAYHALKIKIIALNVYLVIRTLIINVYNVLHLVNNV